MRVERREQLPATPAHGVEPQAEVFSVELVARGRRASGLESANAPTSEEDAAPGHHRLHVDRGLRSGGGLPSLRRGGRVASWTPLGRASGTARIMPEHGPWVL